MIVRDFTMENISFVCSEIECEQTGIKIQRITMVHRPFWVDYRVIDTNGDEYCIPEQVFNTFKKLLK